ncbi:hypothetical protein AAFC00_004865 [Neodothiora populina]|uniref:Uncharacterized protein n=1 Tax=Neodothiora populina TaxID=2781224 RepID=A0ABR3P3F2_9PEZI
MAEPKRTYASMFAGAGSQSNPSSNNDSSKSIPPTTKQSTTSKPQPSNNQDGPTKASNGPSISRQAKYTRPKQQQQEPNNHYIPETQRTNTHGSSRKDSTVYVLTFLTSKSHHDTMTSLRKKYFPPHLNKLDAHLTLFHALPGDALSSDIIPTLQSVARSTSPFPLNASRPFMLGKHGIAIAVPKTKGGEPAAQIHETLQAEWMEMLSPQDAAKGGFRAHYTVMNKVDDESVVQKGFEEIKGGWEGCEGVVEGLSLFRYERGRWVRFEDYKFEGPE